MRRTNKGGKGGYCRKGNHQRPSWDVPSKNLFHEFLGWWHCKPDETRSHKGYGQTHPHFAIPSPVNGISKSPDIAAQAVLPWRIRQRKSWTLVTGSSSSRPPNVLALPDCRKLPSINARTEWNRPPIDTGRQLSTWVDRSKTGMCQDLLDNLFEKYRDPWRPPFLVND